MSSSYVGKRCRFRDKSTEFGDDEFCVSSFDPMTKSVRLCIPDTDDVIMGSYSLDTLEFDEEVEADGGGKLNAIPPEVFKGLEDIFTDLLSCGSEYVVLKARIGLQLLWEIDRKEQ